MRRWTGVGGSGDEGAGVNLKEQSVRADVQKKETDVIAVFRFDRAAWWKCGHINAINTSFNFRDVTQF